MCGGRDRNRERRKAERERKKQERIARERQEELNRIAKERQGIVDAQEATRLQLQTDADNALIANAATVKDLEDKQEKRLKKIRDDAAAESKIIADQASDEARRISEAATANANRIMAEGQREASARKLAGGAASSSLRALAQKPPAVNAARTTRRGAPKGGARASQPKVQRGSQRSGRGPNLSI